MVLFRYIDQSEMVGFESESVALFVGVFCVRRSRMDAGRDGTLSIESRSLF